MYRFVHFVENFDVKVSTVIYDKRFNGIANSCFGEEQYVVVEDMDNKAILGISIEDFVKFI